MKKVLVACIVTLVALGAGIGVQATGIASQSEPCVAPATAMQTEVEASVIVLEAYIAENIAPLFKNPQTLDWTALTYPAIKPGKIAVTIGVGEQFDGFADFYGPSTAYELELVRECAGGEWTVAKFKRIGKPEPLAQKPE